MKYFDRRKLLQDVSDFIKLQESVYNDHPNITVIQWNKLEAERKLKLKKQEDILKNYIGGYFKDNFKIHEITESVVHAGTEYAFQHIELDFEYDLSFKNKLLDFNKDEILVEMGGRIKSISKRKIILELISIKKYGCFVATVCYGSYHSSEVVALRQFRDERLLKTYLGKVFVNIYYFFSPFFASLISKSELLKKIIRAYFLDPLVVRIQKARTNDL